jgi:hypothetical protein
MEYRIRYRDEKLKTEANPDLDLGSTPKRVN